MPLNRYQIRNEYSLADPELYKVADKDDPEALLEGVAMAGLVGVLRQLGDLAEFAAEIFHDLHEEVMATASRGHGLIVRVQQLEAEFPSIERTLLSQTSHTAFLYNAGVDWHPNPRMDQSVVTRGDLPRFVMDSYEECRGPPRLFLLDKFDVAGAGACLKRFTDPSFFKMESTLSTGRKLEGQREKKTRRVKKRGPRWRNGDTPESFPSSHAKLHQLFLEERIESGINDPARRVKLKKRQFTGSMFDQDNVRSYMEKFLDTSPQEQKILHEICIDALPLPWTSDNACEPGLEIVEIGTISPVKESIQTDRSLCSSPDAREMMVKPSMDDYLGKNLTSDNESMEVPGLYQESHDGSISTISKAVSGEEIADKDSKSEVSVDDVGSEIDNYVDALANIESEVETDTECKENPRYLHLKPIVVDSDGSERQRELQSVSLDSQSVGNSVISEDGDNFSKERDTSSCSNSLNTLNENTPHQDAAVMDVPTVQAFHSDSDNISFDHHSTSEEILRKGRQKHAAAFTVHAEVDNILKNEHEFGEDLNTSFLADLKKVVMPIDLEDSSKETHLPDLKSEDSAKRDSILEHQEHTNQIAIFPSFITYSDASEDSGHYLSEPSNHDKGGQNSNVYSGTPRDMLNISDGLVHLLETDSHNLAYSSVERHDKNLGMADIDACSDSGSPSKHLPISDPVYLEKTKLIDVACEEDMCFPSTQETSKDLFCISDSSASSGIQELLPVTTDPLHVPSYDIAAEILSCSFQDPSVEDNIAVSEERVSSAFASRVVQAKTNSAVSNMQTCAQGFSSSEITESAELTESGPSEAETAVALFSKDEANSEISGSAEEKIVNDYVSVEKPSPILDPLETRHERLRIPSGPTDTSVLELCQDVACIQDSRIDTCTGCSVFDGGNEDKAALHVDLFEREPDCEGITSLYPDQTKVSEPETLVDDPGSQATTVQGEPNVDHASSDQHGDVEKIFSRDTSLLDKHFEHANDSDYVMAAENDSDLDHDAEKVKHIETVADGLEPVDDSHQNIVNLSSSLSLHPEKLQEHPVLVNEEVRQYDEELTEEHGGEFIETRQIDPVRDTSLTSTANICNVFSDDSISLLDCLPPEDVKTSGKLAVEAPLASENRSEPIESTSSHQIAKHLNPLSHDLIAQQSIQREESAGMAALHDDDQSTVSKTSPQSSEYALDTSNVVFHGNGMLNDANKATQVESLGQPLSQQGFPDLRMRPDEPQINLEPPSLPPLPPMQWRLGRFQNSSAPAPVERQMMQHTVVPLQIQPMSLPTMHHNLAPVQPMTLPAVHRTLASFQPVPLAAGNSTLAAIPPATLPAVHYAFTPLRPVTLPSSGYGTETIAQTFTSEGQLGFSDGYMTQQGVFTLPMPVGVSDGFFQINSSAFGRQDNLLSAVPSTSTNLDGYVTQQGIFPPSMPAMASLASTRSLDLASTRSLEGIQISEESYPVHHESGTLIEGHCSEHTSTMEAKFGTANGLLGHSPQVLEEEAANSFVQPLRSSAVDRLPPGLVASDSGRTWLSAYDGVLTHSDGTTNGTLQKKPPRPRNPLIVEVVAIDKSKLRKVERVKPPLESKLEEGESLREQMQLRKVERVKLPSESKVEGGENLLEQLQLRKVGERVRPQVEQKAEEKEFFLEQLQLRKVHEKVKPPVEPKSEEREFSLEQLQLRKVEEKTKQEVEPKVEETEAPLAHLRKVSERFREEAEMKVEETESPRVQLRKVAERAHPLVSQSAEERDSLFEQIRNKSFNLKPAVAARPNIQGPRTNLKVAAILEKASNIRQAMAGSDEDEDADSWSDDS